MKQMQIKRTAIYMLITATLVGCDSIPFINNEPDYKGAGRSKPLEVPPDLTAAPVSDAYAIPGNTSYSSYSQAQESQEAAVEKVLTNPDGVRLEKTAGQSWLVVNAPAEKVWPVIREFWAEQGFAVRSEDPKIGVMETEWINADAIKKDDTGNFGEKFDKWLDSLSGTADKKKFRTRLDRGEVANTTEIYMTHRSVNGAPDDGKNRVKTQLGEIDTGYRADAKKIVPQDARDAELDAELLRRLMVKLGVEEQKSKAVIAQAVITKHADLVKEADGSSTLMLTDSYDRAWRRVGLALDRIGFIVVDKDRSEGTFFVRYTDMDVDGTPKKKKGLLDRMKFWSSDDKEPVDTETEYRVKVSDAEKDSSKVIVVDKAGAKLKTNTANRIVTLLYEQLK